MIGYLVFALGSHQAKIGDLVLFIFGMHQAMIGDLVFSLG